MPRHFVLLLRCHRQNLAQRMRLRSWDTLQSKFSAVAALEALFWTSKAANARNILLTDLTKSVFWRTM
jgi:broad-specificity NMP kinase